MGFCRTQTCGLCNLWPLRRSICLIIIINQHKCHPGERCWLLNSQWARTDLISEKSLMFSYIKVPENQVSNQVFLYNIKYKNNENKVHVSHNFKTSKICSKTSSQVCEKLNVVQRAPKSLKTAHSQPYVTCHALEKYNNKLLKCSVGSVVWGFRWLWISKQLTNKSKRYNTVTQEIKVFITHYWRTWNITCLSTDLLIKPQMCSLSNPSQFIMFSSGCQPHEWIKRISSPHYMM